MASDCFNPGDNFLACASRGCPGSPTVTIEIVVRQFCHVIVLPVAPSGRRAPADRVGLHRVGVYLRLMDKAAFNASQCPVLEPTRAAVMRWTCVRDWHLGPRGHAAARGDRVCVCGSGNDASRGVRPNRRQTLSLSPTGADDRAAIAVACRLGITALWSILLALGDLTLPSTIVAGGTLAGIRHWLRWRWRWHVIASKSKTVIGRAGYVSPRFARG